MEGEDAQAGGWLHVLLRVEGKVDHMSDDLAAVREHVATIEAAACTRRSLSRGLREWGSALVAASLATADILRRWHAWP